MPTIYFLQLREIKTKTLNRKFKLILSSAGFHEEVLDKIIYMILKKGPVRQKQFSRFSRKANITISILHNMFLLSDFLISWLQLEMKGL